MSDTAPKAVANGLIPLVENIFAPEIFVSEASTFSLLAGSVTVTFVSHTYSIIRSYRAFRDALLSLELSCLSLAPKRLPPAYMIT